MVSPAGGSLAFSPSAGQEAPLDADLSWIMENFIGRLGADAGQLAYRPAGVEWGQPLVTVGDPGLISVFSNDRAAEDNMLITAAPITPEGVRWEQDSSSGRKRLSFGVAAAHDSQLIVNAIYSSQTEIATSAAEYAAERLRPVLGGYFRLWAMLRAERQRTRGLEAALNASGIGFFMLDADANLIFANRQAQTLLAANDGLRRKGKSIAATSLDDAYRLHILIDHVISSHTCTTLGRERPLLTVKRSRSGRPLTLSVHSTDEKPLEQKDPAAILYVIDPEVDLGPLIEPVCRLYQLSPMETRLVLSLLDGLTINEASAKLMLGIHTARSYLKQIFIKTATNRQADLVRLMLSSVINVTRS